MQRPVESMILTCPACTTRYLVEPAALGADGRRVRCARCQHTWHAEPLEEEPPAPQLVEDEAAPADAPTPEPHDDAEQDDDIAAARRRSRARAQLPAVRESSGGKLWVAWLILALVVAGIVAGSVLYRIEIVAAWPPAGKLYRTVGLSLEPPFTLETGGIKFENVIREGGTVLLVSGTILNTGTIKQVIPALQVTLLDENRRAIHHWTTQVSQTVLAPKQSIAFQTELKDPPDSARFLKVDFLLEG